MAIFTLGFSAINLVFGRGNFSFYAVNQTAGCLAAYALGLIPSSLIMLYSAVLYAEDNFKLPTYLSLVTVLINIGLNILFVFVLGLGPVSTAIATSIGAWFNFFGLFKILAKRGWTTGYSFHLCLKLFGGGFTVSLLTLIINVPLRSILTNKLLLFIIPAFIFLGLIALYAVLFNNKDLKELARL